MARHYELVLMLDPELPDSERDEIAGRVRSQIESDGTLDHADSWGMRKLAYEIGQRNEADYRFFRFQGDNKLLQSLDHNLKIVDGALRFRIFKVDPNAPTSPPPASGQAAASADRGSRERTAAPAPAAAPAAEPEAPAPAPAEPPAAATE